MVYLKKSNLCVAVLVALLAVAFSCQESWSRIFLLHPDKPGWHFFYEFFTCHLVHWTGEHLFYDLLCFLILAFFLDARRLVCLWLAASVIVSAAVCWLHPELEAYGGLSGLNCAFFSAFAWQLRKQSRVCGWCALLGLLMKTFWEIYSGHTYFATAGFVPIHEAHLAGFLAGLLPLGETTKHTKERNHETHETHERKTGTTKHTKHTKKEENKRLFLIC